MCVCAAVRSARRHAAVRVAPRRGAVRALGAAAARRARPRARARAPLQPRRVLLAVRAHGARGRRMHLHAVPGLRQL